MIGKLTHHPPPSPLPTTGTDAYWRIMREGFAIIRDLQGMLKVAVRAPLYLRGRWSEEEDDYEVEENLGPFEAAGTALQEAWRHPYASGVMAAWGFAPDDTEADYRTLYRRLSAHLP